MQLVLIHSSTSNMHHPVKKKDASKANKHSSLPADASSRDRLAEQEILLSRSSTGGEADGEDISRCSVERSMERGTKEVEGKRGAERKKWYFESERKQDKNHLRTKQETKHKPSSRTRQSFFQALLSLARRLGWCRDTQHNRNTQSKHTATTRLQWWNGPTSKPPSIPVRSFASIPSNTASRLCANDPELIQPMSKPLSTS